MKEIISPRILPVNFTAGKDVASYEFYNPSVAARQLGFGQVPLFLFFIGKIQFRGALDSALSYGRLKDLEPDVNMTLLADWQIAPFATTPFINGGLNGKSISSANRPIYIAWLWTTITNQARMRYKSNFLPQHFLKFFTCSLWLFLFTGWWSESSNNQQEWAADQLRLVSR